MALSWCPGDALKVGHVDRLERAAVDAQLGNARNVITVVAAHKELQKRLLGPRRTLRKRRTASELTRWNLTYLS